MPNDEETKKQPRKPLDAWEVVAGFLMVSGGIAWLALAFGAVLMFITWCIRVGAGA